jgi:hypothetical protein
MREVVLFNADSRIASRLSEIPSETEGTNGWRKCARHRNRAAPWTLADLMDTALRRTLSRAWRPPGRALLTWVAEEDFSLSVTCCLLDALTIARN